MFRLSKGRFAVILSSAVTIVLAICPVCSADSHNQFVIGSARFTVITPNVIRMEYQPRGGFVDLPSTFAALRIYPSVSGIKSRETGQALSINTGSMVLTYTPDSGPFSANNLRIVVKNDQATVRWVPGLVDPLNLGGTISTVDRVSGPVDLGHGLLSRSGWSVVDDSVSPLLTTNGWVESRPTVQKSGIDWYFFGYGTNYRAALHSLAVVSGSVPLPRRYALGVWYSRYWPWTGDDYKSIVARYQSEGFPLDNVVFDMDWHKDGWTGWSWNTNLIPDPAGLLSWMHREKLHDTVNLHPLGGVAPSEDQYPEFMKALGQDPSTMATVPFDPGDQQYMDTFFRTVMAPLKSTGVDFWWLDLDPGRNSPSISDLPDLFWLNSLLYTNTAEGGQRGISFSRWAGWGDQRHPIHFSGDAGNDFPMLAFEVPFTATAGNVGCFFWSNDIGGYRGGRNEESYTRWCQFGAASPVMRSHSDRDPLSDRVPWNYPKWAEDSMRISFHLRSELFPYIYTSAAESCKSTIPLDRPVYIDNASDETAYHNGQEFFLGDNILVAPIATPGTGPGRVSSQTVWFPPTDSGYWYNLLTGEREAKRTNALEACDIDEYPIYARGGVPIPMQPYTSRMGTDQVTTLRVRCYPGNESQLGQSSLYEDDGITDQYRAGKFATTSLSYVRLGTVAKVVVGSSSGHFVGQTLVRSYLFEFPDIDRPHSVMVNGATEPFTYDNATYTVSISVSPISVWSPISVKVFGYLPDGWRTLHEHSMARRLAGISPNFVSSNTGGKLLAQSLALAETPSEQSAVLAVFGIGLIHKNVVPTFYPEEYSDKVFVPYGLVDHNSVTYGDDSHAISVSLMGLHGESVITPAGRHVRVSIRVAGTEYVLPTGSTELNSYRNVASLAEVTVSSTQPDTDTSGGGATDGLLGGYPENPSEEWASNNETTGAWIRLDWPKAEVIDSVWLYDRPNLDDQVTAGTLTMSDGTSYTVGALPNDGSLPVKVTFAAKPVTWVKFTVNQTSPTTRNAGLSEIAVFSDNSSKP